jgi:hypothetical protein
MSGVKTNAYMVELDSSTYFKAQNTQNKSLVK